MEQKLKILKTYWGYDHLRAGQDDIIDGILQRQDVIGLMPTGGGKSITYQIPGLMLEGLCIVISPLIALMQDQVKNLQKRSISAAVLHGGLESKEIETVTNQAIYGKIKFLFIAPERIQSNQFMQKLSSTSVGLITVDEAHCISQWGHDFRPAYLKIETLRKAFPEAPILSLTATATNEVIEDIKSNLNLSSPKIVRAAMYRKNLSYIVRSHEDKLHYIIEHAKKIRGSGIIYTKTRRKAQELAVSLNQNNVLADFYHAGIKHDARRNKLDTWLKHPKMIMVATNAFGMGIDKPDVRFVIHYDAPSSMEAYVQEAGRAGRDQKKAYAVMLCDQNTPTRLDKLKEHTFPPLEFIKQTYHGLGNFLKVPQGSGKNGTYDFNISDFCRNYNLEILKVYNALKILELSGYITFSEGINHPGKIHFISSRDDLYKFQVENGKYDQFIKLILRSYSGLFSTYAPIDEAFIAKTAKITKKQVFEYLNQIKKHGVIDYIPSRSKPSITFLEHRLPEKDLRVTQDIYGNRKKSFELKLEGVVKYTSEINCRQKYISQYFGQELAEPCGICDNCVSQKTASKVSLKSLVLETIATGIHKTEDLVSHFEQYKQEEILETIRQLIDLGKIELVENQLYIING